MRERLDLAILETLHYADIFDYVLTQEELATYLIGVRATIPEINAALSDLIGRNACMVSPEGFLSLPDREMFASERVRLHRQAGPQKQRAHLYARLLGCFPFVRMVALTGGLSMENARDGDIDFLIVCAPGHLWTVRGAAVALVRLARLAGDQLCPNFLVTENRLALNDANLYNAHEIVQMIPLYGFEVYRRFRRLNGWFLRYLPNVSATREEPGRELDPIGKLVKGIGERMLSGRLGRALEAWEMSRKIKKLTAQIPTNADDVEYSSEVCRGWVSGHGRYVLAEFESRVRQLEATDEQELELLPAIAMPIISVGS